MELICPAGTPASLEAAVEAGADAVYCGFRDETNARNFPGLNFSRDELRKGIAFAHRHGVKVLVAINTFARAGAFGLWQAAIDDAAAAGADALILADLATLDYAARRHPGQRLHVSVQAGAANPDAIRFYVENFGVRRIVLPRVLSVMESCHCPLSRPSLPRCRRLRLKSSPSERYRWQSLPAATTPARTT